MHRKHCLHFSWPYYAHFRCFTHYFLFIKFALTAVLEIIGIKLKLNWNLKRKNTLSNETMFFFSPIGNFRQNSHFNVCRYLKLLTAVWIHVYLRIFPPLCNFPSLAQTPLKTSQSIQENKYHTWRSTKDLLIDFFGSTTRENVDEVRHAAPSILSHRNFLDYLTDKPMSGDGKPAKCKKQGRIQTILLGGVIRVTYNRNNIVK